MELLFETPLKYFVVETPFLHLVGPSLRAGSDGEALALYEFGGGWQFHGAEVESVGTSDSVMVHLAAGESRGPFDRLTFLGGSVWHGSTLLAVYRTRSGGWRWADTTGDVAGAVISPPGCDTAFSECDGANHPLRDPHASEFFPRL